jgi:hypothetical protein
VCKAVENVQVLLAKKKSAWTDLDQVNFERNLQCPNVQIEKSAWTGLGKIKGPLQRQVSLVFFRTGHPGVAEAFYTSMACP